MICDHPLDRPAPFLGIPTTYAVPEETNEAALGRWPALHTWAIYPARAYEGDIAGAALIGRALVICSMRQDQCGSLSLRRS